MTQNIKDVFETKNNFVLIDLTAAYNTVCTVIATSWEHG